MQDAMVSLLRLRARTRKMGRRTMVGGGEGNRERWTIYMCELV
jgi:hypothetical protein